MAVSICRLCNTEHHVQSGFFTRHLKEEHSLSLNSITLEEVDITSPNAAMIWNGDY